MNFSTFRQNIIDAAFPEGVAYNHLTAYYNFVLESMIEIQSEIDCFQSNNTSTFSKSSTYVHCGATVVNKPAGMFQVRRVFTYTSDDQCDRVFYKFTQMGTIEDWVKQNKLNNPIGSGDFDGVREDEAGGVYTASSYDTTYRSRHGWYALWDGKIYVAPEIQSVETLAIDFKGIKYSYADDDVIDTDLWTQKAQRAIRMNLLRCNAMEFDRDRQAAEMHSGEYYRIFADLMATCEKQKRATNEGVSLE